MQHAEETAATHPRTSPKSTSLSAAVSPVLAEKEMVCPTLVAAVGGSACRHTVSAPAVDE